MCEKADKERIYKLAAQTHTLAKPFLNLTLDLLTKGLINNRRRLQESARELPLEVVEHLNPYIRKTSW